MIEIDSSGLKQTRWHEFLLRFAIGGAITVIAGLIAKRWGPAVGGLFLIGGRLPFRLGRLPGDISIEGRRGSFYFPIVTCILLSAVLTLIMWVISAFRR